jgi:corrinoid protein of di/trimethylamine methyltransferase
MSHEQFYKEITEAVIALDEEKSLNLAKKAIKENLNILDVIEKGFGSAIRQLGDLWDKGQFYLPELMFGGKIIEQAVDLLTPHLKSGEQRTILGKVVIATIENDIHSIGKTIVGTMLSASGFEVHDLGSDVPAETIVEQAVKYDVDVIGVSALLTTTMIGQKTVVALLEERGIRDRFRVVVGGAPVTDEWVKKCGADGYAPNAVEAVKLVKQLMG